MVPVFPLKFPQSPPVNWRGANAGDGLRKVEHYLVKTRDALLTRYFEYSCMLEENILVRGV